MLAKGPPNLRRWRCQYRYRIAIRILMSLWHSRQIADFVAQIQQLLLMSDSGEVRRRHL